MAKSKSRMTKEDVQRIVSDVPQEYVFRCCDGRTLKNTRELMAALDNMTEEAFACHCNERKSDFSKWVADIIGDDKLARDLADTRDRRRAADIVAQRIVYLEKRIA